MTAPVPRLASIVLLPEQMDDVRRVLTGIVDEGAAEAAVLLLRSGEVAMAHLETRIPQLDTFGALLAANFASAREIALLLGERGFESQVQQGVGRQVVTQAVGEAWILAIVLAEPSRVGLAKVLAHRAAGELARSYSAAVSAAERAGPIDPRFRVAAATAIDTLFQERP